MAKFSLGSALALMVIFLFLAGCSAPSQPNPTSPSAPTPSPSGPVLVIANTTSQLNDTNATFNGTLPEGGSNLSDIGDVQISIVQTNSSPPNITVDVPAVFGPTTPSGLQIFFINVGFGDATLVRTDNFTMLIDTGPADNSSQLVDALQMLGVRRIDLLVLSVFTPDKTGGLSAVLQHFPVQSAWQDGSDPNSPQFAAALSALSDANVSVDTPQANQSFASGPMLLRLYNPQAVRYGNNPDADAIVMRLTYGSFCAFLPSDLPPEQEPTILNQLNSAAPCPVFKWRYHGEGRDTPSLLYDRLRPSDVIISTGPNDLGLPSPTTLERLRIANATVWRTDNSSTIYLTASENGVYTMAPFADLTTIGNVYRVTHPSAPPANNSGN